MLNNTPTSGMTVDNFMTTVEETINEQKHLAILIPREIRCPFSPENP